VNEATRGVRYHVTDEQIREWEKVPVEERLRWLEEMNEFLYSVHDKETRSIWEEFRRGER
jgi:hypothetical protein